MLYSHDLCFASKHARKRCFQPNQLRTRFLAVLALGESPCVVALTLMVALPVAVVYVDIQVMALFLGDFLRKLVLFIFIFLVLP